MGHPQRRAPRTPTSRRRPRLIDCLGRKEGRGTQDRREEDVKGKREKGRLKLGWVEYGREGEKEEEKMGWKGR